MNWKSIPAPITAAAAGDMRTSDLVMISGILYAARDKAHERFCRLLNEGKDLPFNPEGQVLYYMGPSPAPPGKIIGAAGPTTSYRMDPFTETMMKAGIRGFIGKGGRDASLRPLFRRYGAVYFSSFGGAAAYLNRRIVRSEPVAFEDLGPEAVLRLEVKDFPAVVINDIYGGDLYENTLRQRG
jgi:fumarate hydratase subunit beta